MIDRVYIVEVSTDPVRPTLAWCTISSCKEHMMSAYCVHSATKNKARTPRCEPCVSIL